MLKKQRTDEEEEEDMISQLPEPLLHHILCSGLSQKEAVQTCVLSKSWRHLGPTRPKIEFREEFFKENEEEEEKYLSVLETTLQRYHDQNLSIQEFIISGMKEGCESFKLLEKWVPRLCVVGVNKFHLSLVSPSNKNTELGNFRLPPALLLKSEFLTELCLQNCHIDPQLGVDDNNVLISCKHLRKLHLDFVYITDATLDKIMSSCPLIEDLGMSSCKGLRTIKLTKAPNLNFFDFVGNSRNCPSWIHNPSMYFPRLEKLYLFDVRLSNDLIDKFSTHFPCVETLHLSYFSDSERFRLSSRSIKHLTIDVDGSSLKAAIIDAPNMHSFEFLCDSPSPSLSFTTTPTELWWKSEICVKDYDDYGASSWFTRLIESCNALSTSQISLRFYGIPQVVPDNRDGDLYQQPFVIEDLILVGGFISSIPDFLKFLFRNFRPRNVVRKIWVADHHIDEIKLQQIESQRAQYLIGQQNLEDVILEVFNQNDEEWCGVVGTSCLSEFALHKNMITIRFRLKWRIE